MGVQNKKMWSGRRNPGLQHAIGKPVCNSVTQTTNTRTNRTYTNEADDSQLSRNDRTTIMAPSDQQVLFDFMAACRVQADVDPAEVVRDVERYRGQGRELEWVSYITYVEIM